MFARVFIKSLKFVRIDGAQHSRREHALKQAADPACVTARCRAMPRMETPPSPWAIGTEGRVHLRGF
jgi:hypothetical protein